MIDDSRSYNKPMELIIGKKFKLEVWEELIKTMRVGEVSRFYCHKSLLLSYPLVSKQYRKFAQNEPKVSNNCPSSSCCGLSMAQKTGYPDLDKLLQEPSDLDFVIEILSVTSSTDYEKEIWQMEESEKLESILKLKEEGNKMFKNGDNEKALLKYDKALAIVEQLKLKEKPESEQWLELDQLNIPLLLNHSQCKMIEKDYYSAIRSLNKVISKDASNTKAYYRRGKAHLELSNYDEAKADFQKVQSLDNSLRKTIEGYLSSLEERRKESYDKDKDKYKGKLFT